MSNIRQLIVAAKFIRLLSADHPTYPNGKEFYIRLVMVDSTGHMTVHDAEFSEEGYNMIDVGQLFHAGRWGDDSFWTRVKEVHRGKFIYIGGVYNFDFKDPHQNKLTCRDTQ